MADNTQFENPWKGLKSYIEGERLYGRSQDIQALSQYIINNSQTVLYGKSGIGKTSILNAGVFPIARRNGLVPVAIRLEHDTTKTYVQQIAAAIEKAGLVPEEKVPVIDADNETLWEFVHRQRFVDAEKNKVVEPLLVFDQFEEVFTLQKDEKRRLEFFNQLADLLNDVCPFYHADNDDAEPQLDGARNNEESSVKSFDDFTFDFDLNESNSVGQSVYLEDPTYHIVFSLREDFLPQLERYTAYIPVMKNNRFGLLPINEEQAAEIIIRPIPGFVEESVAERIIQKVTGRTDFTLDGIPEIEVDAAVLSLYMSRLFEKRTDDNCLTIELVETFGDNIIKDYYLESISDLDSQAVDIIESWLLTTEGRRNNVSRADLEAVGLAPQVLDKLINDRKILRQFSYSGDMRVEFIHDILCKIVSQHIADKELEDLKRKSEEAVHQKNRQRNREIWDIRMNVLTPFGRKLLDNTISVGNDEDGYCYDPRFEMDFNLRFSKDNFSQEEALNTINSCEGSASSSMFGDKSLDESLVRFEFRAPDDSPVHTCDGIYAMRTAFENKNITDVFFSGAKGPAYIIGGFCGIHLEYDSNDRVVSKTYLNEKGVPTETIDHYATVHFRYDEYDNPIAVRYYDVEGKPCYHIQGNHGYNSVFDVDGNEIERVFVDLIGDPIHLKSGVYGKRFEYYEGCLLVKRAFNLDEDGNLTSDKDGYCGVEYEYDEKDRVVRESYLNVDGNYCQSEKDKYASTHYTYSDDMTWKTCRYYGLDGSACPDKNGVFYVISEFDKYERLVSCAQYDNNGQLLSRMKLGLNEEGHIVSMMRFKANDVLDFGSWLEYNKTRTHVQRSGELSSDGQKQAKKDEPDVYGYDYMLTVGDDLPIIKRAIDKNGNFVKRRDGYIGKRLWKDEQDRAVCEMYYDEKGHPMPDKYGVFGIKIEYQDEGRTLLISNLGKDQEPVSNRFGISFLKKYYDASDTFLGEEYFDIDGRPCPDEEGVYGRQVKSESDGKRVVVVRVDSNKQPMDGRDGFSIEEREFDDEGNIVKRVIKNKNQEVVPDDFGDFITLYLYEKNEYGGVTRKVSSADAQGKLRINRYGYAVCEEVNDDMDQLIQESFYDVEGNLCEHNGKGYARAVYEFDEQGRITYDVIKDEQLNPISRDDGSFGYAFSYKDGVTIRFYLDKEGEVGQCLGGYAVRTREYDSQGRLSEERYFDKEMNPCQDTNGKFGFMVSYSDSNLGRVVTITNLNKDGRPGVNNDGDMIIEKTYDSQDRVVYERTFDSNQNVKPYYDDDVYGVLFEYDDEERTKSTIFVGKEGERRARKNGVCERKEWFDESGLGICLRCYDVDGQPVRFSDNSYIQERVFITEHKYWMLYKDQNGELMMNKEDRSIGYVEKDDEGRITLLKWFDVNRNPIPNRQGDFGYAIEYDDEHNARVITSLDKEGNPHDNKYGFCRQRKIKDKKARDVMQMWFDVNMRPVPNENGEYGWSISYPKGLPKRKIVASLDKNGNPAPNKKGFVYLEVEYRDEDEVAVKRAYDIDHNPCFIDENGNYGWRFISIDDQNIKILISLDENGQPFTNMKGYAKEIITTIEGKTTSVFLDAQGGVVNL